MTPLIITPVPRLDEDIYEYTLNILFYSALIHKAEEGGFWITFPDFPECMTQGEDIQAAYTMAYDALEPAVASRLENEEPLPEESHVCSFDANSFSIVVPFFQKILEKGSNISYNISCSICRYGSSVEH